MRAYLRERRRSLYWRLLIINAAILIGAALLLALTPFTVSYPIRHTHAVVLAGGVVISVIVNGLLLRYSLQPLDQLETAMSEADLLQSGARLATGCGVSELDAVARAYNQMLARLEDERRRSATRSMVAADDHRRWIARELHDEIGQRLTAVLLYLKRLAATTDEHTAAELADAQSEIRDALDEVRRILRELLPQALELGLVGALDELGRRVSDRTGVVVRCRSSASFPRLGANQELAAYRIVQEALTNVVRHAGASAANVSLTHTDQVLILSVTDNGKGLVGSPEVGGIRGMRERAIQVDGVLTVGNLPAGGGCVTLVAPLCPRGSDA